MLFSATKFHSVYVWLFVALLRLGQAQDVLDNSRSEGPHDPTQESLLPTTIETQTPTTTPSSSRASPRELTSSCLTPRKPVNGVYKLDFCDDIGKCRVYEGNALAAGSKLVYSCNAGYRATGDTDVYCSARGEWSPIPECVAVRCDSLKSESTMASCTRFGKRVNCNSPVSPGTRAEVSCGHGYKKDTEFVSTRRTIIDCNSNGQWEPQPIRCVPVCGRTVTHQRPFVFGGSSAKIGDFPWHASLFKEYKSPRGNKKRFVCGGTIIKTNLVLTAAHCIYDESTKAADDPGKLFVITGNVFLDYDSPMHNSAIVRKASVKNVYTNCNYYGLIGNYVSDIALLELQEPFKFSSILLPACLDDSGFSEQSLEPGALGKVAGFGRTEKGETSNTLQTLTLPYISYSECKASDDATRNEAFISSDKFCAGYNNGSAVCEGDSGAGLVFRRGDLWYVMGIVSVGLGVDLDNGEQTCDKYSYSLYTKVSAYLTWIQDVLFYVERNQPYPPCNPNANPIPTPSTAPNVTTSDVALSYCVVPPEPANGGWRLDQSSCENDTDCTIPEGALLEEGIQLLYSCDPGFTADGPTVIYCESDGRWSSTPTCTSNSCNLTDGSPGVCTLLENCQSVMDEQKVGKSPDTVCGSSGSALVVCCPNTTSVVDPPELAGDGRGAIAKQKCIEYSQYANVSECPWSVDGTEEVKDNSGTGRSWPEPTEFPHLAAVGFPTTYDSIEWECGGALISETFVLTSATCFDPKPSLGNATMVRVGKVDGYYDNQYQERRIAEIILCPEYKPPSEYHDIGLIRLESPISLDSGIRPACLHTAPSAATGVAITTKWKYSDAELDEASTSLFKLILPLVDQPICEARWAKVTPKPEIKRITGSNILRYPIPEKKLAKGINEDWLICAGATGKRTCQGDPGGTLVIRKVGGKTKVCMYDVIGVMSLVKNCGARVPALYTRVYNYIPWIESIVWSQK